jgi:hypothetical protein
MGGDVMNKHVRFEAPTNKPAGMLEYEVRTGIRELIEIYGSGGARELVDQYITEETAKEGRYRASVS